MDCNGNDQLNPRKRRRPALSCEQCRRRKVRCDREMPCGPCTKSHPALKCSYVYEGKAALDARLDTTRTSEYDPSSYSQPQQGPSSGAPSSSDGARIAQLERSLQILQGRVRDLEQCLQGEGSQGQRSAVNGSTGLSRAVNGSDDHLNELQRLRPASTPHRTEQPRTLISPLAPRLRGTGEKTKLFGTTHWALVFQQVSQVYGSIAPF